MTDNLVCREEQVLGGIFGVVHLDWGISMQRGLSTGPPSGQDFWKTSILFGVRT